MAKLWKKPIPWVIVVIMAVMFFVGTHYFFLDYLIVIYNKTTQPTAIISTIYPLKKKRNESVQIKGIDRYKDPPKKPPQAVRTGSFSYSLTRRLWDPDKIQRLNISKSLVQDLKVLVETMTNEKTLVSNYGDNELPGCISKTWKDGEAEDLLCIERPKLIETTKNPCWYETDPKTTKKRLRCLPYFHILGAGKSGTTDLWNRLVTHPNVVVNNGFLHKETLWWSWSRYGSSFLDFNGKSKLSFKQYVDQFTPVTEEIEASLKKANNSLHKILITGDASPPDYNDYRGWRTIPQNRGLKTPRVLTPYLMKHIYSKPRFIFLLREPVDRLYTDFYHVNRGDLTPEGFHKGVIDSITMLAKCERKHGMAGCFFDGEMHKSLPVRIHLACYSMFIREWLAVFPKETFLFLKTEEYHENEDEALKAVVDFLDIEPFSEKALKEATNKEQSRVTQKKYEAGPMLEETKQILHVLLDPCAKEVARLLDMDKFLWNLKSRES